MLCIFSGNKTIAAEIGCDILAIVPLDQVHNNTINNNINNQYLSIYYNNNNTNNNNRLAIVCVWRERPMPVVSPCVVASRQSDRSAVRRRCAARWRARRAVVTHRIFL
jgi:hypothetical protein